MCVCVGLGCVQALCHSPSHPSPSPSHPSLSPSHHSPHPQIQELEQFMRSKKVDLPDPLGKDLPEQVLAIVERCGPLFQEEGLSSSGEQQRRGGGEVGAACFLATLLSSLPSSPPLRRSTPLSALDAEGLFFSIASLLCLLPGNQTQMVVELFCDQIISEAAAKDRNTALKLRM